MVFAPLGATPRERFVSCLPAKLWLLGIFWLALGHGLHAQATGSVHFTSSQRELPMIAQNPTGIAVDQDGNIFVVDQVTGAITEDKLSTDAYTSNVVLTGLKSPTAIAVDMQGNLYITEDARYQSGPTDVVKASVASNNSGKTYTAAVISTTGLGQASRLGMRLPATMSVRNFNEELIPHPPASA